jgi:hypothetical protein
MYLIEKHGGYLYQHKPSFFPEGEITGTELLLWEMHYKERNAQAKR